MLKAVKVFMRVMQTQRANINVLSEVEGSLLPVLSVVEVRQIEKMLFILSENFIETSTG